MDSEATPQLPSALRARLTAALRTSMKARDQVAVTALRSAIAALANAEAVPVRADGAQLTGSAEVAGASLGVGSTESARRHLTSRVVLELVLAEATEREAAAHSYDETGQPERADRLRSEAAVIRSFLD